MMNGRKRMAVFTGAGVAIATPSDENYNNVKFTKKNINTDKETLKSRIFE